MTTIKFRYLNPIESDWIEATGESEIDAIQTHHLANRLSYGSYGVKLGVGHYIYFARVETEAGERMISRVFHHGLERRGGVRRRQDPYPWGYEEAAKGLGVSVEYLKDGDWEGESQTWE